MKTNRFLRTAGIAAISAVLLSACSTAYVDGSNPLALFGGYWSRPGPGKLMTVGFNGNGYTSKETAATYLLQRCAELAKQAQKPYFLIFDTPADAVANRPVKDFNVFAFGIKPSPMIYMLPQEQASASSFETEAVLNSKEATGK